MVWSKLRDLPTKVTLTERPSDWKMVARDHLCQSNVFPPPPPPPSYKRDLPGAKRNSVAEEAYQGVSVTHLMIRSSSLSVSPIGLDMEQLLQRSFCDARVLIPAKG